MNYGKYRYEQQKREKEAKKKQKTFTLKEVKLRPHIEDHDFYVKMKNATKFLGEGNKVKVTIMFRGREMSHPELGQKVLTRFADELKDLAVVEKAAKIEGRNMTMILAKKGESRRWQQCLKLKLAVQRLNVSKLLVLVNSNALKRSNPTSLKKNPQLVNVIFAKLHWLLNPTTNA